MRMGSIPPKIPTINEGIMDRTETFQKIPNGYLHQAYVEGKIQIRQSLSVENGDSMIERLERAGWKKLIQGNKTVFVLR